MSCCVPNCQTAYWNKNTLGITMFKPSTEKQLEEWEEILRRDVGLPSMQQKDKVCILHFKEDVIEREHTLFFRGGVHRKIARKRPILSPNATPSIFPENSPVPPKPRKRAKYYDLASPEILAQQRKMYEEFKEKANSTDGPKKVKKPVRSRKRKCEITTEVKKELEENEPVKLKDSGVEDVATGEVESEEEPKIGDLFDYLVKVKHEKRIFSKYLPKDWISNFHDAGCISWTLWNDDCSGISKRIVLYCDLTVDCYLEGKSICLPGISKIETMHDFENLTKTYSNLNTCMGVEDDLGEENCLNFVIINAQGGRPQLRCAPCSRLVRNLRRRKGFFVE
ncbi:uncharacterized protein LOC117175007 [Belonocnema kinseyi]|uniref:uncharacterized protein LOC117175007 n=1 Tax=Belonocnema kinseyi TaxID=2817044 RepID=UPI00143CF4B7|nr:uncharacterized protein LOC117175007 [Belonocnema kinseyi]